MHIFYQFSDNFHRQICRGQSQIPLPDVMRCNRFKNMGVIMHIFPENRFLYLFGIFLQWKHKHWSSEVFLKSTFFF